MTSLIIFRHSVAKGALAGLVVSVVLLLTLLGVLLKILWRRQHRMQANHTEAPQDNTYRYNATAPTAEMPSRNTLTTYTTSPTIHPTPDRERFHKVRYGFANHRRNEESVSVVHSVRSPFRWLLIITHFVVLDIYLQCYHSNLAVSKLCCTPTVPSTQRWKPSSIHGRLNIH